MLALKESSSYPTNTRVTADPPFFPKVPFNPSAVDGTELSPRLPACLGESVEDLRHRIVPRSRQDFAVAALASAGVLLLVPRLVSFWNITSSLVLWPWQFDFDEGHNLNATVLLAQGTNI